MRFICFMCPSIIILYIVKIKNNSIIDQIKLYLVSLPVINAFVNLLFLLFSTQSRSAWNRVEGNMLLSIKYIVVSFVISVLWALFLECIRQKCSIEISLKKKKVAENEKESNR